VFIRAEHTMAGSVNVNLHFLLRQYDRYDMTGAPKHGVPIKMNCMFAVIMPAHIPTTLSTNNEAPDQYLPETLS
jgi:hypothetical protein